MGQATFGHLQLADRGAHMAKGPRPLPFQDEGEASGVKDRVPKAASVIAAHSNAGILTKLGDTKYFGETICRLLDSDGFPRNLHNCFYTMACGFVQALVFIQVPAVVDACSARAVRWFQWYCLSSSIGLQTSQPHLEDGSVCREKRPTIKGPDCLRAPLCHESQSPQPHFKDGAIYRPLRPTRRGSNCPQTSRCQGPHIPQPHRKEEIPSVAPLRHSRYRDRESSVRRQAS